MAIEGASVRPARVTKAKRAPAVSGGEIAGYAYTGAFVGRTAYDWAAETTIYLAGDKKKMGLGRRLYQALEDVSRAQNIINLNACIGCLFDCRCADSAVCLNKNIKTTLCALCFDFLYFRQHIRHKALTAKTRFNSHNEHHKQFVEIWENCACRCVRLNYKSGFYAVFCDFINSFADVGVAFCMKSNNICAGFCKIIYILKRF